MPAPSIVRIAGLVGEAGRVRMLTALLDGRAHPASELALAAAVSPQTASSHLAKLLSGGMVVSERIGRQRLFRLANLEVATAIEALGALAADAGVAEIPDLRFARTCYDHLAGVLGIAVRNGLLKRGAIRHGKHAFLVTRAGAQFLHALDIEEEALRGLRRSFARKCLDWTERQPHIGGAVGAALLSGFVEKKWLVRQRATRAVRVTHAGERAFEELFGIRCAALRAEGKG